MVVVDSGVYQNATPAVLAQRLLKQYWSQYSSKNSVEQFTSMALKKLYNILLLLDQALTDTHSSAGVFNSLNPPCCVGKTSSRK